ncbi:hypothetical protein JCM10213_006534 [Rhodosporidiobolus nylandii]
MSGYDSSTSLPSAAPTTTKRRRVAPSALDSDYAPTGVAPSSTRAKAYAPPAAQQAPPGQAHRLAQQQQAYYQQQQALAAGGGGGAGQQQGYGYGQQEMVQQQRVPILSLASLPPAALQRYLSRYGLLPPHSSLSYHHAVFPVPLLPATLHPPLDRDTRTLQFRTAKRTYVPAYRNARLAASTSAEEGAGAAGEGEGAEGEGKKAQGKKRKWVDPKTPEFAGLTAFDPPERVMERLAVRATAHWEKRDTIKEAETLTNFMFSCRSRGHTLRATPAG